ncbi:Aminodeoxyfutalosine synthase [Streptomyces glaucescens]
MDVGLERELEEKVRSGERLTREDGIALYESDDLAWLGGLAHEVRTRKNGDVVHFNVNRHLNMTNVCTASCAYCSFQRKPGEKDAYTMRIEEAVKLAKAMEAENLTELHIVNGLHPEPALALLPALPARAEGRAAERLPEGVHRDRDPPLRDDQRAQRLRDPRRADRRRPGVAHRRRRRDLRLGGPAAHRRPPDALGGLVRASTGWRTRRG